MCGRYRKTIRKRLNGKNGTTLVELIVTFALIGLFMAAATAMLTSSLQLFSRMQATASAVNVSDLILDKIAGEIVAADIPERDSPSGSGYYFWLEPSASGESRWVVFRNRSQSPIAIFAGESGNASPDGMGKGQLFIKYYAVSKEDQKAVEEIDWHFDKNVYMGYRIKDLHFEQEKRGTHPNVVTIYLTIRNDRTGFEYSSRRYAECYNYDGMYLLERDDGTDLPDEAVEFEIKKTSGGGGEEPEEPEEPETIEFMVINRLKQEDGTFIDLLEGDYKEIVGRQFVLTPEENLEYNGKTYKCVSPGLNFTVTSEMEKVYYIEYEIGSSDDFLIVKDSTGKEHKIFVNLDWDQVKYMANLQPENPGWGFTFEQWKGFLLHDSTGFYVVTEGQFIKDVPNDLTLEEFQKQVNYVIKVDATSEIYTKDNIQENGDWKPEISPKKGEFFFYEGTYYLASSDMGAWSATPTDSRWYPIEQKSK